MVAITVDCGCQNTQPSSVPSIMPLLRCKLRAGKLRDPNPSALQGTTTVRHAGKGHLLRIAVGSEIPQSALESKASADVLRLLAIACALPQQPCQTLGGT